MSALKYRHLNATALMRRCAGAAVLGGVVVGAQDGLLVGCCGSVG